MNLIADTNAWYDIGSGRRDPVTLKSDGNRLIATPISFLEIASRIDERNFADRKNAAQAVIDHADEIAEDSESHLAKLWGFEVCGPLIAWIEGFRGIAQASSAAELEQGVNDLYARVKRTVKLPIIKAWREYQWDDFREKVTDALDQHIPGYRKARENGKHKRIDKRIKKGFIDAIRSSEIRNYLVDSTFVRALLVTDQEIRPPTRAEHDHAEPLVSPYVDAYTQYIIGCATEFAPQSNDLGDSECFVYLQNGASFFSNDKRWVKIARMACLPRYFDPESQRILGD